MIIKRFLSTNKKIYFLSFVIDCCQIEMSTVIDVLSSSIDFNDQHVYSFDHQQQMIIENRNQEEQTTTTNNVNEDEHCQICGDLSSGWHCG
jgi:NADH:ubiquinone oxidoreductase subunit B-like Fe-S oxidoreductase